MDHFTLLGALHIRLTCDLSFDVVEQFIKNISSKYIISHEVSHYHCYVITSLDRVAVRLKVNTDLSLKGNGQFSIADVRKPTQMKKYILKDGFFRYFGFTDSEISVLKLSSVKKGMDKYSDDLVLIEDRWFSRQIIHIDDCIAQVIQLQVSYGIKPRFSQLQSYAYYLRCKRDPICCRTLAAQICDRV